MSFKTFCFGLLTLGMLCVRPAFALDATYIALGDSLAFGQTGYAPTPSYGDQGYVKPYADWLQTRLGARPKVINLGISAELSSSYLTGQVPSDWGTGRAQNLNYAGTSLPQSGFFLDRVAAEQAAGRTITHVSFAIGANDMVRLSRSPDFLNAAPLQQFVLVQQTLLQAEANYTAALSQIRATLPNAEILLLNYPIPPLPPNAPTGFEFIFQSFNDYVQQSAQTYNARYVDIYTPFLGNTSLYFSTDHPNDLGYSVIAEQMKLATVPEPTSVGLFCAASAMLIKRAKQKR